MKLIQTVSADSSCINAEKHIFRFIKDIQDFMQFRNTPDSELKDNKVAEIKLFLQKNYHQQWTVNELASQVGLSRSHFTREFVKYTGISPHEYQIQLRLQRAKQLLQAGNDPVDTAYESGFCDQSHLNRWLKRVFYVTPKQFYIRSTSVQDKHNRSRLNC